MCKLVDKKLEFSGFTFDKNDNIDGPELNGFYTVEKEKPFPSTLEYPTLFRVKPEVLGLDYEFFDFMHNVKEAFCHGNVSPDDLRTFQDRQFEIATRIRQHCANYGFKLT
jgi:hypothetical protein